MATVSRGELTQILAAASEGDRSAADRLLPLVYDELRVLAAHRMALEPAGQTLEPTALVHEVYLRLIGDGNVEWQNRAHFFAAGARAMRRILVERARHRKSVKGGGGVAKITLFDVADKTHAPQVDLVTLDDALTKLETEDPRACEVVMLRYFGGLGVEETAETVKISPSTVKREWSYAKAWLHREIGGE